MNLISPCVALCKLTEEDICIGCKRTIEEIISWRTYTDNQKKAVFTRLENLEKEAATQLQPRKQVKCGLLSKLSTNGQTLTKFKQLQFKTTLNAP